MPITTCKEEDTQYPILASLCVHIHSKAHTSHIYRNKEKQRRWDAGGERTVGGRDQRGEIKENGEGRAKSQHWDKD